jgi:transposase-like protein
MKNGQKNILILDCWKRNWNELSTFFKYPKIVRIFKFYHKKKTKQKGSFPSKEAAFKIPFTSTQEVMEKWKSSRIRNWSEIYPQLVIYFQDILVKYI